MLRALTLSTDAFSLPNQISPEVGNSSPAISLRSVVLPDPDGPSSATSSPERISSDTPCSAGNRSNALTRFTIRRSIGPSRMALAGRKLGAEAPFEQRFHDERDQGQHGKQRGDGKSGGEGILIVEDFDMQRHGVGHPSDVARNHRDRPELAHRPGIAQKHAIKQAPFDVWQGYEQKGLESRRAERQRHLLLARALLLHQRNELAGHERKGDEYRGENDAGH